MSRPDARRDGGAGSYVAAPVRASGALRAVVSGARINPDGGRWDGGGARRDGVPPQAFGPWDALEALPLRGFGLNQPQLHRRGERFEPYPAIVVLCTEGDSAEHWVRAGQALQRVLLAATVHGLAATPMNQPLEIPALRELLTDTTTGRWAQVILRLGYAQPTLATPRRHLTDVLLAASP
jgi:nitroreductase